MHSSWCIHILQLPTQHTEHDERRTWPAAGCVDASIFCWTPWAHSASYGARLKTPNTPTVRRVTAEKPSWIAPAATTVITTPSLVGTDSQWFCGGFRAGAGWGERDGSVWYDRNRWVYVEVVYGMGAMTWHTSFDLMNLGNVQQKGGCCGCASSSLVLGVFPFTWLVL